MSNEKELKDRKATAEEANSEELSETEAEQVAGGGAISDIAQGVQQVGGVISQTAQNVWNDLK